ncbi:DUF3644 domain-containing protein [Candidatus Nomurabacteria bacterium]|nr:DUF3644 domain-containing protein [Candidatus Nomurabacteria bacterium]
MAKQNLQSKLLDKSVASIISAIEIYNKPDFAYREEIFSILLVNAWELLLKAKVLKDNKNKVSSIQVQSKTKTKKGDPVKRFYPKENRSGNPYTLEIFKLIELLKLPKVVKDNLEAIIEIRDNSIHFYNSDKYLSKKIQEICTASLKSYLEFTSDWFSYDMSKYNFYLMPISFFHPYEIESFSVNKQTVQEKNLLKYFKLKERKNPYTENSPHNFSLNLVTKFEKGSSGINTVRVGKKGASVFISEESLFKTKYTINKKDLVSSLKNRYSDFKQNSVFNKIIEEIKSKDVFCKFSYLDPVKKSGIKRAFFSSEVYKEMDKHYTKI